jgi:hypothetical protein
MREVGLLKSTRTGGREPDRRSPLRERTLRRGSRDEEHGHSRRTSPSGSLLLGCQREDAAASHDRASDQFRTTKR